MTSPEESNYPAHFEQFTPEPVTEPAVTRATIVAEMRHTAPPGQDSLDPYTYERLRVLTGTLLAVDGDQALSEYERFNGVQQRGLELQTDRLREQLLGKTILVTGGTGCIGTALLEEFRQFNPGRVISVSRGITTPRYEVPGTEYVHTDLRDKGGLEDIFEKTKPDIVYHLAAQHDPSLAETAVAHTLSTNITGTRNVIEAARKAGTPQVVYASTGKALRPYTPDTYAASKKASEWLMAEAAAAGDIVGSGVRFTHVVNNSIIHKRLQNWIATDSPIRLHGSDILFYTQSAKEAAHLLLNSGLEAERGAFNVQAIRDLEWPVNLVDLALGAVAKANTLTPIYFCGFESGYEEQSHPALYDPMFAGETSPLINALEAPQTEPSAACPQIDAFPFEMTTDAILRERLQVLEEACSLGAPDEVLHWAKNALSWAMLATRLRSVPTTILERTAQRMQRLSQHPQMNDEHNRTNRAVYAALQERQ